MTHSRVVAVSLSMVSLFLIAASSFSAFAQQSNSANAVVPTLVQFSGVLSDADGKPLTGVTGVTFALYAEQEGGAPMWVETQNIQPGKSGHPWDGTLLPGCVCWVLSVRQPLRARTRMSMYSSALGVLGGVVPEGGQAPGPVLGLWRRSPVGISRSFVAWVSRSVFIAGSL